MSSTLHSDRNDQLVTLLLDHPSGMRPAEIARELGVNRSTISRYNFPPYIYENESGCLCLNRATLPVALDFTLDEAMAVHLATRLLATRMDRRNPHAASALRKLGKALTRFAPNISRHVIHSAEVMEGPQQITDVVYLSALQTLTRAWAEGRKTHIVYRRHSNAKPSEYIFSPYFIEPNAVGQSTYVIGWAEPANARRNFKIERIESIELLDERYRLPDDFDPSALLANSWGIWITDAEPVQVVLRFSPSVVDRVNESRWHSSEEKKELDDGSLQWSAWVSEPLEVVPWIRGWGSEVEVLEPLGLRQQFAEEARALLAQYSC